MALEFEPIDGSVSLYGIDLTKLMHEVAEKYEHELLPLENVLRKKRTSINKDLVKRAQARQAAWRKNTQRIKERKEELARPRQLRRTDDSLVDKRIALLRTKVAQQQQANEKRLIERNKKQREIEKDLIKVRIENQVEKKRAERLAKLEKFESRRAARRDLEPPPEEIREKNKQKKNEIIEQARKKTARKSSFIAKRSTEKKDERKEKFKTAMITLKDKVTSKKEIIDKARERLIEKKNRVAAGAAQLRAERKEGLDHFIDNLQGSVQENGEIVSRARQRASAKQHIMNEKHKELREERQERIRAALEDLAIMVEKVDEIEKDAQARAAYNDSLIMPPPEHRRLHREMVENIQAKRNKAFNEKLQPFLEHYEEMKQRMIDIFESSDKHREDAVALLDHVFERGRRLSFEHMLASGNPGAKQKVMTELDYFAVIKSRIITILEDTHADRKERMQDYMHMMEDKPVRMLSPLRLAKNPIRAFRNLERLERHFRQKRRELYSQIVSLPTKGNLAEILNGIPDDKKKHVYKLLHRLLSNYYQTFFRLSKNERHILLLRRRQAPLYLRSLIDGMIDPYSRRTLDYKETLWRKFLNHKIYPNTLGNHFRFLDKFRPSRNNQNIGNLGDIQLILKQENLRAILSGTLLDKAFKADTLLKGNLSASLKKTEKDSSYIGHILNILKHINIERQHTADNAIYTIIDIPYGPFSAIGNDTGDELKQKGVGTDKVFEGPSAQERAEEHSAKLKEHEKGEKNKKTHAARVARRKRLVKLIEEQNMTAQEKANNERNLIDFFF